MNTLGKNFLFSDLYRVYIVLQSTHSKSIWRAKKEIVQKVIKFPTTAQYQEMTQKSFLETSYKKDFHFLQW